jgi:hypothetical protein
MDLYKLDVIPWVDGLPRDPGKSLRIQMVLRPVHGQRFVVDPVELQAGEHLRLAIGERDGDERTAREMPVHPDEAIGVLLEIYQCVSFVIENFQSSVTFQPGAPQGKVQRTAGA